MKLVTLSFLLFCSMLAKSQIYDDSLVFENHKYFFIKLDSAYYTNLITRNKDNVVSFFSDDETDEVVNIAKYKSKVERKGDDLVIKLNNDDSIIISNNVKGGGEGYRLYQFLDYNQIIGFYIVFETCMESHNMILINEITGKQFTVPANFRIMIDEKKIIGTYIDLVNGGSWLEGYFIQNDELISSYKLRDLNEKWLFADAFIDYDQHIICKRQLSYSQAQAFEYYKIIKK